VTWSHRGARVSALTAWAPSQVSLGVQSCVPRPGHGRTARTGPVGTTTARTRPAWGRARSGWQTLWACPRARGTRLTRHGSADLLPQVVAGAGATGPSRRDQPITPQTLRHTTATHVRPAGVALAVIARWLGHERTATTQRSLAADLATNDYA
jgi:site-specific recombinase XerD